jgi:pimeloyl-ACP methyl ester carboxylesterase
VAAFAPDEGETLAGMGQPYGATPGLAELRTIADGYLVLTPKGVSEDFAQDLSAEEKNTMAATQGPTQGAILATKITKAAWRTKPSWFVIADHDRMIAPEQERATAKRMKAKTLSLATSHVAMLAKPKEVAEFIIDAAASLGAAPLAKAS